MWWGGKVFVLLCGMFGGVCGECGMRVVCKRVRDYKVRDFG